MYQTSGYDPISEQGDVPTWGQRKAVWMAGVASLGLLALYGRRTSVTEPQTAFDYTSVMPKGNAMTCLQSSCNSAMAGLAMNSEDPDSQNLTSCLTFANDEGAQQRCFASPIVQTNPQAAALHLCALCKHCIQGTVSQKKCDTMPQGENDLRGPPSSTSGAGGYGFDYSQYMPGASPQPAALFEVIPGTSALWSSFLTDAESASPVIPTGVIPDGFSSSFADANAQAKAGLAQSSMAPEQRTKIENKIASRMESVDDKVSDRLEKVSEKVDDILDHANDKAIAGIDKGQDKAAAGMERGQEKAEAGIEKGQEKEAAGIAKGQDKAAAGIDRGLEKEQAGIERGQDKAAAGIERGQEKAQAGIERGQEKAAAGIERGQEKEQAGIERGQDKAAAGLDRANAQIEKHLDNPNIPANVPSFIPNLSASGTPAPQTLIAGTNVQWSKFLGAEGAARLDGSSLVEAKSAKKPLTQKQEKTRLNACIQMNCNSAVAAVGASSASSPLARCIQMSKTAKAVSGCFKSYPSPQGENLKTCLICQQCLPGSVPQIKCDALIHNPNDVRGP